MKVGASSSSLNRFIVIGVKTWTIKPVELLVSAAGGLYPAELRTKRDKQLIQKL
jgi:hypothetical protein